MSPVKLCGVAVALAALGAGAGTLHAGDCGVCGRPPAVAYYGAPPCGPQACHYEWVYPPCGPIKRFLGLCRPKPVLVCGPAVAPPPVAVPAAPCPSCATPAPMPGGPPPVSQPAPSAYAPPPATPNPDGVRYYPAPPSAPPQSAPPQSAEPPMRGSSYQPQRMPAPVPAQPLTPPAPPVPIALDRIG